MRGETRRLIGGGKVHLRETGRAVTPFGGLVVLLQLMRRLQLMEQVKRHLPFAYASRNQIKPEETLLAFWLAVAAGAKRFAHVQGLRCDEALRQLAGITRMPGDDTVRNFFRRFGRGEVERFFPPLWQGLFAQLPAQACTLDLDSTVFQRYGEQEGALVGYNPVRHGRASHHPLLAVLAEPALVLHSWLRSGQAAPNREAPEFLAEALALVPATWTISGVRADAGFFDQKLLRFLEDRQLPYVVVARRREVVQTQVLAIREWQPVSARYSVGEFALRLPQWDRARRCIVVREQLRPDQARPQLTLLKVPGYSFRVLVTNRTESAEWLWHHYDGRAAIEPRFSELKSDLGADDFCLHDFHATEAALRAVTFLFNLLSLLQKARGTGLTQRPATLRSSLFTAAAIAGRAGRTLVMFYAESWGGLTSRYPLLRNIAEGDFLTSPKLDLHTLSTAPT